MFKLSIVILVCVAVGLCQEKDNFAELLESVFTPPTESSLLEHSTRDPLKFVEKCGPTSECVPYYLCRNGEIVSEPDIVDFDIKDRCQGIFDACCDTNHIMKQRLILE